jgi:hypothetical protein
MTAKSPSRPSPFVLKTAGYLVSSFSVLSLGVAAWASAAEHPLMLACLIAGMAASITGMGLRWWSYFREKKENA